MYIVKLTFTYPRDRFKTIIEMRFPITEDVVQVREQFIKDGKIIAIDNHFNKEFNSVIHKIVYKSEADYVEYSTNPACVNFFRLRDQYCLANDITKSVEYINV